MLIRDVLVFGFSSKGLEFGPFMYLAKSHLDIAKFLSRFTGASAAAVHSVNYS